MSFPPTPLVPGLCGGGGLLQTLREVTGDRLGTTVEEDLLRLERLRVCIWHTTPGIGVQESIPAPRKDNVFIAAEFLFK